MAEEASQELKYSVLFFPGGFFLFWNVLVPLSVLMNVRNHGLCVHEIGLFIALALNPFLLKYVLTSPVLAWALAMFLIIWIQRVLKRWSGAKIYTLSFLRSLIMLTVFIVVPSTLIRFVWDGLCENVTKALRLVAPGAPCDTLMQARDLALLVGAVTLLLHSFYFYNRKNKCVRSQPTKPKKKNSCGC